MTAPKPPADPSLGPRRGAASVVEVRVDRIACTGHGICASILPATVHLDEWGYPVVDRAGGDDGAVARAAAVRLCPAMALSVPKPA